MLRTPVEKLKIINYREEMENKMKQSKRTNRDLDKKLVFFAIIVLT